MVIRQIEYRATRSFGSYENETIGATAELVAQENHDEAQAALAALVNRQLDERAEARGEVFAAQNDLRRLKNEARDTEAQVRVACERWEKVKAFMVRQGLDVSDLDIPF